LAQFSHFGLLNRPVDLPGCANRFDLLRNKTAHALVGVGRERTGRPFFDVVDFTIREVLKAARAYFRGFFCCCGFVPPAGFEGWLG